MKFTLAAIAALVGAAAAAPQTDPNHATVINNCKETVYVQSVPYDGSKPGPLVALKHGARFDEKFRASGSTVKIAKDRLISKPLQFGYNTKNGIAYYEFNNQFGNPFANQHNILSPGDGCQKFDCKANDKSCYSNNAKKIVPGCPLPVSLVATVCA